jgi:hypothetical protein
MTWVLVDQAALGALLRRAWDMFVLLAEDSGFEEMNLEPTSELVVLACQAGLPIPGPLKPGTLPPPPPQHHFDVGRVFELMDQCMERMGGRIDQGTAMGGTYRAEGDPRLRCVEDGKVVYTSMEQAEAAARRISDRQPMKAYRGPQCGHYHVSRVKRVDLPHDFR